MDMIRFSYTAWNAPINIDPKVDPAKKYAHKIRLGKTRKDRDSGAHKARFSNREKPIRQTSSHRTGGQDNRGPEFWGG
jgi:hypothetical protein